jgi:hypothetical protein
VTRAMPDFRRRLHGLQAPAAGHGWDGLRDGGGIVVAGSAGIGAACFFMQVLLRVLWTAMENTWASGAIELIRHADSHIPLERAFDLRIAFISIDNSVETSIRTFLSLPESKSGVKVSRKDVDATENRFPGLVELLWKHAGDRLSGIDNADIEYYHRIRNKLYHEGTGFSVDRRDLLAYRQIAVLLLKNLLGVDVGEIRPL